MPFGTALKSVTGAIARAFSRATAPVAAVETDALPDMPPPPGKSGHPPSRCYGDEISYHCDSW